MQSRRENENHPSNPKVYESISSDLCASLLERIQDAPNSTEKTRLVREALAAFEAVNCQLRQVLQQENEKAPSGLASLSDSIITHIFSFLDPVSLSTAQLVCKKYVHG